MSLRRLVQISAGGTHLVSVPAEVVGEKYGRPLEAVWKYNTQVKAWVVELRKRSCVCTSIQIIHFGQPINQPVLRRKAPCGCYQLQERIELSDRCFKCGRVWQKHKR
jgi:hypothetical protein